jgi:hypothetical protein
MYEPNVDYEHEHRFAEYQHEGETEIVDEAEQKWRSAVN